MSGSGQDPDPRKWIPLEVLILPSFPTHAKANWILILSFKREKNINIFFLQLRLFILGYLPPEQLGVSWCFLLSCNHGLAILKSVLPLRDALSAGPVLIPL